VNTEILQIEVSGLIVDVVRKNIKNLHLAVYPPTGRVRVAAPLRVNDEAVRLAILRRLSWIKRQRLKFIEQDRQSVREYVSGESHYFQGRRYRLNVVFQSGHPHVEIRNRSAIDLFVRPESDREHRERIFLAWYRRQIKSIIPALLDKWEKITGVSVSTWGVKHMKTKWGTCNAKAGRIWLNLELAKKPIYCLEYIIVHELIHFQERNHNENFKAMMDHFLPHWQAYREELNRFPLRHEDWDY
jgi:predicted metal-dependent hydrolase